MAKYINPAKVVTGVCRFSYANLWEAKAMDENSKPKYSVSLIIPKSDTKTIEKIRAAIQAAYEEGQGKLKGNSKSVPPLTSLKTPLRDGDLERPDDEAYANSYFVNANSITAPGIVDAACQQILDPARFTAVSMAEPASPSMRSTPKHPVALPAACRTSRSFGMANRWAVTAVQRTTSQP